MCLMLAGSVVGDRRKAGVLVSGASVSAAAEK